MSWCSTVVLLPWISTLLLLLQSAAGFDGAIAAAPDGFLQAAFQPWTRDTTSHAWTGGDVGASCALTPTRTLWVFGDTLIGHWEGKRRVSEGAAMPHSSVGVWDLGAAPRDAMTWRWGPGDTSFFRPSWESSKEAFWAAVTAPRLVDGRVLVLGNRVSYTGEGGPMGFRTKESFIFTIDGAADRPDDPASWTLDYYPLPHTGNLSAGGFVDFARGALLVGPWLYLYGNVRTAATGGREVLSRIPWADLRVRNFSAQEYWTGAWRRGWSDDLPEALATLWSPQVAEMQPQWCDKTGSYVALTIPFGSTRVELRAAPAPEGPWSDPRKVYDIPPPQNDTTKFFCYATMQHDAASLPRDPSSPPPDLVFTYVCNGRTLADVFAEGAEASYTPQFVRLSFL